MTLIPSKSPTANGERAGWRLPAELNIGVACSDVHAERTPEAPAIIDASGPALRVTTFGQLSDRSCRLAAALAKLGIGRGDRIAIMVPQSAEAAIAHLATYKLGAIAVPLATQFGPDAIAHRLEASGAAMLIGSNQAIARARSVSLANNAPRLVVTDDNPDIGTVADAIAFGALIENAPDDFTPARTTPDDPAMMLFTSGTTGQPKGALHGHRVLPGHLPGIDMAQHGLARPGAILWTPSDWAWAGGLLNALLPALWHGVPVVAARAPKFDPDWALDVIARSGATNLFMPATALRLMIGGTARAGNRTTNLRVIGTAGEPLGATTLTAAQDFFGVPVNEFYGQTECNAVIANSQAQGVLKPGAMGKPVTGHTVAILSEDGTMAADGQSGEIAIKSPDPVMFIGYWQDPGATAAKYRGDWLLTGDLARMDDDGYIHFLGRVDDLITSSGYRIGPAEIEDCLNAHPAVALAAVIGEADATRTQIVSAYVKLTDGTQPSDRIRDEIAHLVRTRLSAHQYPRKITFVDDIPLTESGKVIRRYFRTSDTKP